MHSVLIAEAEDTLRNALVAELRKEYRVFSARDGAKALELLRSQKPDILILSMSLRDMDGLFFLEEASDCRPDKILCLTCLITDYIAQAAKELGVSYMLLKPCTLQAITRRVRDLVESGTSDSQKEPEEIVAFHLEQLGIQPSLEGHRLLRVGAPLFSQDTTQNLSKELYPHICSRCNCSSTIAVERAIRTAIQRGWDQGDRDRWLEYFPGACRRPSNREFLFRISQFL